MSIKDPAGWGTTWGGSKQCVTSLGKKEERFQWNQHVSASALGGINKKTAEEKWWHCATGEFIYSCLFELRALYYNASVNKRKNKKAHFWPDWVFDFSVLTRIRWNNTAWQQSRERKCTRNEGLQGKAGKVGPRAKASLFKECWTAQRARTFCGRKAQCRRDLESFS